MTIESWGEMVVFKMVFFSFFSFPSTLFECFPHWETIVCVFVEIALVDFPYKEIMAWQKFLTVISRSLWVSFCRYLPALQGLKDFLIENSHNVLMQVGCAHYPFTSCHVGLFTMHPSVIEMWLEPFSGQSLRCEHRNTLTNGPTINIGVL